MLLFRLLSRTLSLATLITSSFFCFSQQIQQPIVPRDSINLIADTISITLDEAEAFFLKNNYSVLAQQYGVDAQKSLIRQAKLFNNPTLYYEQSVYNQLSKQWFPTQLGQIGEANTQGEYVIQAQWLVSIARKRIKTAQVAKLQADVAQYQFDDVIRGLLFALRQDFFDLHFGLKSLQLFDEEIASVRNIVEGFEMQYQKGNASLRDVTRVRALLLSLQSDRLDLYTALQKNSSKEFAVLLNNPKNVYYKPILNEAELDNKYNLTNIALADLVTQALESRPDLKASFAQLETAVANVQLQKAIGVPDLQFQYTGDRNGSYIPNYNGAGLQIPVELFNRNQFSIQSAKLLVNSAQEQLKRNEVIVQNDVFSTYQKILELQKFNVSIANDFSSDFRALLKGAQDNFAKKNLSLLDFVDIFESYKASMAQYNSIKEQRYSAFEELNFNVGKDVFKK
jgi:cobalt-zinc-cadmium efflux system outer membrane protein